MAQALTPAILESNISLGIDLLNNGFNRDVTGIFDQDTLQQLFVNARPMKARIRERSKVMDHPVETGSTLSDHRVIEPVQIELPVIIKSQYYSSTFQQLRSAMINATLLSVQTKACIYPNIIIEELPREEDPEMFNVTVVGVRLREVLFIVPTSITTAPGTSTANTAPANYAPADPAQSDTVNRGLQAPVPLTSAQKQSIQDVLNMPAPS